MPGLIKLNTELQSRAPTPGTVVLPGDTGLGKAAESIAGDLSDMGKRIGALADHAAQAEGREAGHQAGMDPEFRPTHNRTLRGDAYDAAGLQVASARIKQGIAQDFAAVYDKNPNDPATVAKTLATKADAWKQGTIADLQPEVALEAGSQAFQYVRQATRNRDHKVAQDQAAALQTQVHESLRQLSQTAYAAGLDPTADDVLSGTIATLQKKLGATDLRGNRLVEPAAAARMIEEAKKEVATSRTFGAYDRLPDLTSKEAFIKKFGEDFASSQGTAAAYDFAHFQRVQHGLLAQYSKDKTAASVGLEMVASKVKAVTTDLENGYPIAPDRMAGINAQITMLGPNAKNEKLSEQIASAQVNGAMVQRLQVLPPDEQAAHVAQLRADAQARGAAEGDTHTIAIADKLLANTRAGIKTDMLGWATKTGLYKVPPLDLDPRRNDIAQQLQQRVAIAESIGKYYKAHMPGEAPSDGTAATADADAPRLQYFTPDERQMLGSLMAQGGKSTLLVASTIAQSPRAEALLADLGKHAPTMAMIGRLVAQSPGAPPQVALDAAGGLGMRRVDGYQSKAPKGKDMRDAADSVLGTALTAWPERETAAINTANAAYEVRAHVLGEKEFNAETWKKTLSETLGEREIGGQKYGGIYYQGTGWLGGGKSPIVLPPDVRQGAFDTLRNAIKITDLEQAPKVEATTPTTRAGGGRKFLQDVPPADLKRATWKTAGDGQYFLALGDPDGADPRYLLNADGRKFVLDLNKLAPALRDRVPSAFLGGN